MNQVWIDVCGWLRLPSRGAAYLRAGAPRSATANVEVMRQLVSTFVMPVASSLPNP